MTASASRRVKYSRQGTLSCKSMAITEPTFTERVRRSAGGGLLKPGFHLSFKPSTFTFAVSHPRAKINRNPEFQQEDEPYLNNRRDKGLTIVETGYNQTSPPRKKCLPNDESVYSLFAVRSWSVRFLWGEGFERR